MIADTTRISCLGCHKTSHKSAYKESRLLSAHRACQCNTISSIILLLILLLGSTPSVAQDANLELRLNNVTHALINPLNFDAEIIPLQSLFPYLETIEYLEVRFAQTSISWDANSLDPTGWDNAFLTFHNQNLELRVGTDKFSNPLRISVHGIQRPIGPVQIWSSMQIPQYKSNLLAALALRDVEVKWKEITELANRLENPPPQGMPHLVIVDQLRMLRLDSLLNSPHPIMTRFSQWYSIPQSGSEKQIAIDAYHPESALLYLLADDPDLFDRYNRLPDSLITFLNRASMSNGLVVSAFPMAALASPADNQVTGAVRLPSSQEVETGEVFMETRPPTDAANIIRYIYAAIPANISGEQGELAKLVLEDASRLADLAVPEDAVAIPHHPRIVRFFDAYRSIGRLAISNQIPVTKAAELINAYVADD